MSRKPFAFDQQPSATVFSENFAREDLFVIASLLWTLRAHAKWNLLHMKAKKLLSIFDANILGYNEFLGILCDAKILNDSGSKSERSLMMSTRSTT